MRGTSLIGGQSSLYQFLLYLRFVLDQQPSWLLRLGYVHQQRQKTLSKASGGTATEIAERNNRFCRDGIEYVHECFEADDNWDNEPRNLKSVPCNKNPGHKDFLPIRELTVDHLKEASHPEKVLERMMVQARLSVRVVGRYVSLKRPTTRYLGAERRGDRVNYCGSGIIPECSCRKYDRSEGELCKLCSVMNSCYKKNKRTCPCRECEKSGKPKKKWYMIPVFTAKHVIYNNEEAQEAEVNLYFDDPHDKSGMVTLHGSMCKASSDTEDICVLACITHKREVFERINRDRREKNKQKNETKSNDIPVYDKYHYIISHPHGCSQHISLGRKDEVENEDQTTTKYKTCTCMGSSGACIGWVRLEDGDNYCYGTAVHSGKSVANSADNIGSKIIVTSM